MKNKIFKWFYLFCVAGVLLASVYPIMMGTQVISDLIRNGVVKAENYPKYIIPYTPISVGVILGVALMPLALKYLKKWSTAAGSAISIAAFFGAEFLFENIMIETTTVQTTLESWQMAMCYVNPSLTTTRTWTEVDVLIGEYSPAFKIHFYVIAVVLILALLNCFYGFGHMVISGDRRRLKSLVLQSVSSVVFLGLCIFACFTAFFRTGEIQVAPVSAVLMCAFFVVFGLTAGIYTGSFLLGKKKGLSIGLPAVVSAAITLVMYVGEMILLSGNLYRFGTRFFFTGLGILVLAPVDILIILVSGVLCAGIMTGITRSSK